VANIFARRVRPLIAVAAVGCALLVAPGLASASPHQSPHPKPTINSVQKALGQLALKNTQLVEKYDQAQVAVAKRDKAAKSAQHVAQLASARYARTHSQFVQVIQAQYEGQSLGATGALLSSNSGTNYLDRLSTLDMLSEHTAQIVAEVTHSRNSASAAAKGAEHLLTAATRQRDSLRKQKSTVAKQIDKYRNLLSTLNSAQQADYLRAANPSVKASSMHLTAAGTGAARKAVQFALNQVGKPYVFGAGGPGSYDCSGLTMASWSHAGVNLPHSAADQYNYGHHVSRGDLQPGDLIFFYQPIGHVTIYVGDGMMVSAPTEGEDVSVVPLNAFNGDYTGATRLT
jgi:peptidoglycan DL-endopeptidase CwlO